MDPSIFGFSRTQTKADPVCLHLLKVKSRRCCSPLGERNVCAAIFQRDEELL